LLRATAELPVPIFGHSIPRKSTCQLAGFAVVSELPIKAADAGHPDMGRASSPPSKEIAGQFNSYLVARGELA
jgi:hypothetical protein